MAWDWIKVELATPDKAEVCVIATTLGIDIDAAFGKLFRVWAWFNQYTTDGHAPCVTKSLLDRVVCVAGFCDAMKKVGWMEEENSEIILVNFARHNGETAKTRAMSANRSRKYRSQGKIVTDVTHPSRKASDQEQEQEQEQEQDKEQKTKEYSLSPTSGTPSQCPHHEIIALYNSILSAKLTAVKPALWNGKRETSLRCRWKEDSNRQTVVWWREYFETVKACPFLLGENEKGWRADMEWLVNQANMIKVLEGKYKQEKKMVTKKNGINSKRSGYSEGTDRDWTQ